MVDDKGYEYGKICDCRKKQIEEKRLSFMNLPTAYRYLRLSHLNADCFASKEAREHYRFIHSKVSEFIEKYDIASGKGLYFSSYTKGTGKTKMIASVGNELSEKGYTVKFATSATILNEIKATWNAEGDSKLLNDLATTQVLIIDDFGAEKTKDWINEKFFYLINERYLNRRPTFFTSNYPLNELDFDERIKDRVKEMAIDVPFPEEGLRQTIAEESKKAFYAGDNDEEDNI